MKRILAALLFLGAASAAHAQFGPAVSVSQALTATGSNQAGALVLGSQVNVFTNVASGTGAVLPWSGASHIQLRVYNNGANSLSIYPPLGASIDSLGTNAPYTLAAGSVAEFTSLGSAISPGSMWVSSPFGGGGASGAASITSGTVTGLSSLSVNVPSIVSQNNIPAFVIPGATRAQALALGLKAGNNLPANSQFLVALGASAAESISGSTNESSLVGDGTAIMLTTGAGAATLGVSTCSGETVVGCTAIGNDAMRDTWEAGTQQQSVAVGAGAYGDGMGTNPVIAIGTSAVQANMGTITFTSGAPHVGDVYTLTPSTTNPCGTVNCTSGTMTPQTYTVVSGDTTATILVGHIASAWSAAPASSIDYVLGDGTSESTVSLINTQWQQADVSNHPLVLKGHWPGGWFLNWTVGCTGTCAVTPTYAAPFSGGNIVAVGSGVLGYFGLSTAANDTIVGNNSFSLAATTAHDDTSVGFGIAPSATTALYDVFIGSNSANAMITGQQNVFVGSYSGYQATGSWNTILGDETTAGQGCITNGGQNLEIGMGACVPTATASNQLSIQNILYGTGNSGTGTTVSTGSLGVGQKSPGARFDILGTGTSTELAFRIQNSTPTVLFSVADNNTITVAGTAAVSCAANTVSLTTLVVTDGIVTHC